MAFGDIISPPSLRCEESDMTIIGEYLWLSVLARTPLLGKIGSLHCAQRYETLPTRYKEMMGVGKRLVPPG